MSRLTIDITEQQHRQLKAMAAMEGKTLRRYALERLFQPETVAISDELRALLNSRIAASEAGAVSKRSFDEIVEEVLAETAE